MMPDERAIPPAGPVQARVIVISGLDGSGKTTVIDAIRAELRNRDRETRYVWLRYNHYLTKGLLAVCRLTGLTEYRALPEGIVGQHHFYRSRLISWAFITLTLIDTTIASFLSVHLPMKWSKKVVICDRWVLDTLVDLEVDTRMRLSRGTLVYRMFMALLPADCVLVVLERDLDLVMSTRAENIVDPNFARRCALYERHQGACFAHVVKNDAPPVFVAKRILQLAGLAEQGASPT